MGETVATLSVLLDEVVTLTVVGEHNLRQVISLLEEAQLLKKETPENVN